MKNHYQVSTESSLLGTKHSELLTVPWQILVYYERTHSDYLELLKNNQVNKQSSYLSNPVTLDYPSVKYR